MGEVHGPQESRDTIWIDVLQLCDHPHAKLSRTELVSEAHTNEKTKNQILEAKQVLAGENLHF